MKKRSAWFAAWFAVLIIGVVAMMAVAPMGKAAEQKQFIVGFDAEFPPYGYMDDNGEYVGFDLDLAAEVCKRNGWKLVKRPIAWDSKDSELATGAISCIWNGFTMNGREDNYTWSTAYVDNSQVVIVKKDSNVHKLSDLKGKRLIVQSDSSALAALTGDDATKENKKLAASLKDLQQVADYNSAFMNLESGMVDAIAMDIGVASYQMSAKGDNFRMLDERLSSEEYGIGFKKGNTKLRDEVQKTLLTMLADGTFEQIVNKWGLKDSACLSEKDTTYIDGGKVPYVDFSKIQKKNDKTTEKSDGVKANKGGIWFIMKQLGQWYVSNAVHLCIYVVILASSWTFDCGSENVTVCSASVDCKNLHFDYAWYAVDVTAFGCVLCSVLCVRNFNTLHVSFVCGYYWIFPELCGVFRRDLPFRYSEYSAGTARSGTGHGIRQTPDVFPYYFPTDGQTRHAAGNK